VQLAKAIGARAVAEGVETAEQLDQLRAVGCPLAQGYYLSRPVPKDEMEALLAASAGAEALTGSRR
jgi:EAL domain-containing protein (putative c-di-GMP-specific phosphodiesterase class I)